MTDPYYEPRYEPPKSTRQRIRDLEAQLARTRDDYMRHLIEETIDMLAEQDAVDRGERQ